MAGMSRRRLLGSALGIGGATAAASLLPPNLQQAMAESARHPGGSLDEIEHVVILMQENRSFDHYFGTMPGVRGFDDPNATTLSTGRSVFYQPDPENPDGYLLPFHLDTKSSSAQAIPSTSHAWSVQHSAWNNGAMDNWVPAHRKADGEANGPYTMGYYKRDDIPFHFALAESFTLCDAYHCSMLGPTWPNRLYHWTGTVDPNGLAGGPVISNVIPKPFRWTTYPERLAKAGVSWHVYQEEDDYGCNPLEFFQSYQDAKPGDPLYEHGLTIGPTDQFARDALAGRLPTVSWIIPTAAQCEHPDYLPASGADFVARQLDAVAANRDLWRKTVFILNYDENDGLFDHVVPPTPPAGTADEFIDGVPIGAGIRVPCVIVSPWTLGGYVCSEPFDHTSVLRFLERITGVRETNISEWRRRTFGDLTSALGLPSGRSFPQLPPTKDGLWQAEKEIATLPPAPVPGADQTPPHQEAHRGKTATAPTATASGAPTIGARPYSLSRAQENATTHRADFSSEAGGAGPAGSTKGTDFPGIQESVPQTGPTTGTHAYATGLVSYSIAVIDTATHALAASIPAGTNPSGIAAANGTGKIYVANSGAGDVSVLDTTQGKIVSSVTVGLYPHGVASSPDGGHVYVANTGPDTGAGGSTTLSVIDTGTDKVSATWRTGLAPHSVAPSPDGRILYVTCYDGLSVLDAESGRTRARLTDQAEANGVAVHPDGKRVLVVNTWQNALSVIDTRTLRVTGQVRVGRTPWQVAISPDGSRAYVSGANDDTVSVIDTASLKVLATVRVNHVPTGITATADTVWVCTNAGSTVDAIDTATLTVVGSVPLGLSTAPSGVIVV
ncbi:phospholipase [Streptomyces sp. PTM05]|uniref:phospholipase C n=1 Tax=Streptantibioticus parmotrematis TaxID=2873249 RepID=A0ABS7QW04_9ACTN|nr:phospholipase [Streptantibioticus parmotrematis]